MSPSSEILDRGAAKADWVRPATAEEFMAQYVTLVYTLPRIAGAITAAAPQRLSPRPRQPLI